MAVKPRGTLSTFSFLGSRQEAWLRVFRTEVRRLEAEAAASSSAVINPHITAIPDQVGAVITIADHGHYSINSDAENFEVHSEALLVSPNVSAARVVVGENFGTAQPYIYERAFLNVTSFMDNQEFSAEPLPDTVDYTSQKREEIDMADEKVEPNPYLESLRHKTTLSRMSGEEASRQYWAISDRLQEKLSAALTKTPAAPKPR